MRYETVTLTESQSSIVSTVASLVSDGDTVSLTYAKRDKDANGNVVMSSATGEVIGTKYVNDSTAFVKLDTERGPRTINAYLISTVNGEAI
jgi:hypothetical protein